MPKYCVAYINFYDNIMTQEIVKAKTELDALRTSLEINGYDSSDEKFSSIEEVKQFAFDCDSMVSAIEI